MLRRALLVPQGLVLITGPTGSGKTSTLYSAINEAMTPEKNIVTLEDPVEVQLPGITQVQVNAKAGLTFAAGLRSVLRQDPDVVLVGEVRDAADRRAGAQGVAHRPPGAHDAAHLLGRRRPHPAGRHMAAVADSAATTTTARAAPEMAALSAHVVV